MSTDDLDAKRRVWAREARADPQSEVVVASHRQATLRQRMRVYCARQFRRRVPQQQQEEAVDPETHCGMGSNMFPICSDRANQHVDAAARSSSCMRKGGLRQVCSKLLPELELVTKPTGRRLSIPRSVREARCQCIKYCTEMLSICFCPRVIEVYPVGVSQAASRLLHNTTCWCGSRLQTVVVCVSELVFEGFRTTARVKEEFPN